MVTFELTALLDAAVNVHHRIMEWARRKPTTAPCYYVATNYLLINV